jgi:hypothetical protein
LETKSQPGPVEETVEAPSHPPAAPVSEAPPPEPLPPIESLTPESDFAAFMKPEVDPGLKRQAFKKLIEDPRFNVMDGLDVYIDDYSKPDPLPEGWLEKMNQVKHLGIFQPPPEEASGEGGSKDAALQNSMPEQPLAAIPEAAPADTSAAEIPPPGVGKTEPSGEGA